MLQQLSAPGPKCKDNGQQPGVAPFQGREVMPGPPPPAGAPTPLPGSSAAGRLEVRVPGASGGRSGEPYPEGGTGPTATPCSRA